jgi:hypothetical protein
MSNWREDIEAMVLGVMKGPEHEINTLLSEINAIRKRAYFAAFKRAGELAAEDFRLINPDKEITFSEAENRFGAEKFWLEYEEADYASTKES